ncbi:MAG: dihydroorotate dehydrogenase electron transfer subunit [Magnetococcales bacterium]|nr:dihydroorotate dehydrogenase electron transfer subunit [Magnetococcales bacterium]
MPERHKIRSTRVRVLFNRPLPGDQYLLRLHAPSLYPLMQPGHFVHLESHASLTLPRPFSVLGVDQEEGAIDLLYKVVGQGTRLMAEWRKGDVVRLLGPVGNPFAVNDPPGRAVLVAGGIGLAPLDFLARHLATINVPTVLMVGSEGGLPFPVATSRLSWPGEVSPGMALSHLESLGIPSRLASLSEQPGVYRGFVTELLADYLRTLDPGHLSGVTLYVCGPTPMMAAVAHVAREFGVDGQASLEEHMACGFGGCAGCVAPIRIKPGDWGYRRVCVDGPVFPLLNVAWEQLS